MTPLGAVAAALLLVAVVACSAWRRFAVGEARRREREAVQEREALAAEERHLHARVEAANDRLRLRTAALQKILRASTELKAHLPLDAVLENVARAASASLGYRRVLLSLLDRAEGVLVPRAHVGLDEEWPSLESARVPVENRLDDSSAPDQAPASPLQELRAGAGRERPVGVPLVATGRLVGYLELEEAEGDAIDPVGDRIVLDLFASQAVHAVRLSRAYKTARLGMLRDPLTGVANHGHFQETLRVEVARHERTSEELVLLMVDLDGFKAVNDTYGHPVGDAVLRGVVARLLDSVREMDTVARYGGEEFAVILPQTSAAKGQRVAERLREAVAATPVPAGRGGPLQITVSIGLAVFPEDARTKGGLVECADKALYAAKRTGKNRVVRFTRVPSTTEALLSSRP